MSHSRYEQDGMSHSYFQSFVAHSLSSAFLNAFGGGVWDCCFTQFIPGVDDSVGEETFSGPGSDWLLEQLLWVSSGALWGAWVDGQDLGIWWVQQFAGHHHIATVAPVHEGREVESPVNDLDKVCLQGLWWPWLLSSGLPQLAWHLLCMLGRQRTCQNPKRVWLVPCKVSGKLVGICW